MLKTVPCVLLVLACGAVAPRAVMSQDMHVYTTVYDQQTNPPEAVARSLSLFHGGKTYDFIDKVGEVIIFEPAAKRFTLLNTKQMKAATILCEEVNGKLKTARDEYDTKLVELSRREDPKESHIVEQFNFQLDPHFEEHRDQAGLLTLSSHVMSYQVKYAPLDSAELVQAYLNYADWACRLNYVLHPGRILPEPRLALNNALRKAQAIPTEVELTADVEGPIHLKAEHTIHLNLDEKDRDLIHQWEKLLASKDVKKITIYEYQRSIVIGQAAR